MLELMKPSKRDTIVTHGTLAGPPFPADRERPCQPHRALDRAASLIHDMRNPLAAICGSAELLMGGNLDQAQTRRLACNLHAAATRMRQMLTEHAAADACAETVDICNLRAIIVKACDGAGVIERGDIDLRLDVPLGIEVPMVRLQMQSVFRNLIVNAVEAMPLGGSLRIGAMELQESALIEIEDSGPGLPPEIRRSLFEPFTTAGKKDGLGLGLALSRRTVEDHGGELWAEPAAGARFVISLPLAPPPAGTRAGNAD